MVNNVLLPALEQPRKPPVDQVNSLEHKVPLLFGIYGRKSTSFQLLAINMVLRINLLLKIAASKAGD